MKLMALAFASFSALFAITPFVNATGDAVCQVKVKYTGTYPSNFNYAPLAQNPIKCEGSCTNGECKEKNTPENSYMRYVHCQCPVGGGGDSGCRGKIVIVKVNGTWVISAIECVNEDECPVDHTCSPLSTSDGVSNYLQCSCQPIPAPVK